MDQQSRNKLQNATQDARQLLEAEFAEQLEGTYDILPDGTIHDKPGVHLNDRQRLTRQKLVDAIQHRIAGGKTSAEAVAGYTREAAFTFLNRFVALKMLEARRLVQQCISKGEQSSGFKEFTGLAPGLAELPDKGYRLYLECLFDELSIEVKILFDRQDVASLLWPRRQALDGLLATLNQTDLDSVWDQDETIGWVYQYFNSSNERKKMREESQAPRNSHELAVRNQFFTPRYVVEFVTDNTLGRIWYEMRKGKTRLVDECRYLVRRPSEVFLDEGQEPPTDYSEADKGLSQEELLKKTVYVQHRPKKAPRDLKILDPACGSGHFLLYCFNLLLTIYKEAWHDEESPPAKNVPGPDGKSPAKALHEDYPTIEALLEAVPRLILRHNLHGIEIDPRCGQIAAFALWLQAQRAYSEFGAVRNERSPIRKTNIVIAEPMPGEPELLKEFTATLNPPLLGKLVEVTFEKMKLAGEAGSLLKIEEEIRDSITKARKQWGKDPEYIQMNLFGQQPSRQEKLDFSGITDDEFWHRAEERIYEALHGYVTRMSNGQTFSRRLFADDAAHGFAFVDLCRKRYDVVLMNPPFGSATCLTKVWFRSHYPTAAENLSVGTIQQSLRRLSPGGFVGLIGDLPWLQQADYAKFRSELLRDRSLKLFGELGWGILGTDVEVAVAVFTHQENRTTAFVNLVGTENQANDLLDVFSDPNRTVIRSLDDFAAIENSPFAYQISDVLLDAFKSRLLLSKTLFEGAGGVAASEANRVFRCWWEVGSCSIGAKEKWSFCQNGSPYCPLYYPTYFVIRSDAGTFVTIRSYPNARTPNSDKYWKAGLAFGKRTWEMYAYPMPADQVITWEGQALFPLSMRSAWHGLALANSSLYSRLANLVAGQHKYAGYLNTICLDVSRLGDLSDAACLGYESIRCIDRLNELSHSFSPDALCLGFSGRALDELVSDAEQRAARQLAAIDDAVSRACGEQSSGVRHPPSGGSYFSALTDSEPTSLTYAKFIVSLFLGCAIGRWDIRLDAEEKPTPELPDPFAPLPVCPPSQLQNEQGLPITREEVERLNEEGHWNYPIEIPWDGILVDDIGHSLDLKARVRQVLQVIWKDRWEAIESEACELLGVRTLRDYFCKPGGFFADHLKRYSKSHRKAPIYWQLATPSGSYSIWLYYHRFTKDTFYKVLKDHVKTKVEHEQRKFDRMRAEAGPEPTRSQRSDIVQQETFVAELKTFTEEIERIAPLWNPDLNDGVIINFAPLWRLVPQHKVWQKECKKVWDKLVNGDYDWAHLAMHMWPERIVPKCRTDASLAIAHGLEDAFWEQDAKGKWAAKDAPDEGWESTINKLVAERTSPAVKAALDSLLNAPAPGNGKRTRKIGKRRMKAR